MERILKKTVQARRFIFSTPTKSIEFLNGLCITLFGAVFVINGTALGSLKFYDNFRYVEPSWLWWLVVLIGILQLNALRRDTLDSNILSAILMKLSSLIWFLIAILFGSDYPPLSTAFFTYLSFSFLNLLGGFHLSAQNTYELLIREEFRNG